MTDAAAVAPAAKTPAQEQADRVQTLFAKLWADPKTAPRARELARETYPGIVLPEDQMDPVVAPLRSEIESLTAWKKAREEADAEAAKAAEARQAEQREQSFNEMVAKAALSRHLTEDGKEKMLKRMLETKNYTDAEAAADWVVAQSPKPRDPGPVFGPQSLDAYGSKTYDESWKDLHKDPAQYLENELRLFVDAPERYVSETLGQAA